MDRRSWLWRRKSSEKSPGETESSGSVSSHSERYSDDQEVLKVSPNHAQSPEVSSKISRCEDNDNDSLKSLTEKLSSALLNIRAKEDLVKQHAKVAEEAVSGWEKAETEVAALKHQLEVAAQKNSALEDRISQLDGALKECVRQLRQSREEQDMKVHDALIKKTRDWESEKFELESALLELKAQSKAAKEEGSASVDHAFQSNLEALEKEHLALKVELLTLSEELKIQTLERELSTQAAETASKQHLESIKKVAKLEAECRRLRAMARKTSSTDQKPTLHSVYVESVTDSQSDSGERFLGLDNEPSCSDSWASALIAELDQFKCGKVGERNLTSSSAEIDLMDDFLEMERIAALHDSNHCSPGVKIQAVSDQTATGNSPLMAELEALRQKNAELEETVDKIETERANLEKALAETQDRFEMSCNQLKEAEGKLLELQRQLDSANNSRKVNEIAVEAAEAKTKALESELEIVEAKRTALESELETAEAKKKALESELETAEAKRKALESELETAEANWKALESELETAEAKWKALESELETAEAKRKALELELETAEANWKALESELEAADIKIQKLREKVGLLEGRVEEERILSVELATKCQNLEEMTRKKREAELQRTLSSNGESKMKQEELAVAAAGKLAECQKTIASLGRQLKSLATLDDFMLENENPELNCGSNEMTSRSSDSPEAVRGSLSLPNGKERQSPASYSSPSSSLLGFTESFSRISLVGNQ